jgi:hypothetical protein
MSAAAGEESAEDLRRSGFNIKVAAQQPSVVGAVADFGGMAYAAFQ